jgi:arginase family enzyme
VNYPTPGGLDPGEASTILRALLKTGKLRVLELAAYNASKDHRGASAKAVISVIQSAFH